MAQSIKDQIRAATLGKKSALKSKVFDYEGVQVEVRQPNLKAKKELIKRAKDSNGDVDIIEYVIWSVILSTFEPGTDTKVFEPEDYDTMINQGGDSFVEKFSNEISELMVEDNISEKNG